MSRKQREIRVSITMKIINFSRTRDGYSMDSRNYKNYVESVKNRLPKSACAFMSADWHYQHMDYRCPHDSRIINISIIEETSNNPASKCSLEINLIGGYGNEILIKYDSVFSYELIKNEIEWPAGDESHGDWLIDELILLDDGMLNHEIIFTNSTINIKSRNIEYTAKGVAEE